MLKRFKLSVLLISVYAISLFGFSQVSDGNRVNTGISLVDQQANKVIISHTMSEYFMEDVLIDGQQEISIKLPGVFLPNDEGAPDLPGYSRMIAMPQGATAVVNIISSQTELLTGIEVAPAPRIPDETEDGPLFYKKNDKIYSKNEFYPANPVYLSDPSKIRGVDVVTVGISPFQYNPVSKELLIFKNITIEIKFIGGNDKFGESRLRSRWWDPILKENLLNAGVLPAIDYNKKPGSQKTPDYEYVIIVPDNPVFIQWADSIKNWRNLQGIKTGIVTLTEIGGNTVAAIESWVDNAYYNWDVPPSAILLLGDYGTGSSGIISQFYTHPAGYPDFVSDNRFADVTGDELPDIAFARITANDATQLQVMISKFLNYERNPPTSFDFYDHPITALGWQTERWFQICSEAVGGYFKNVQGKNPVRINAIYSGTPGTSWSTATNTSSVVNYFGPNGLGYIPATPAELGGWTGGTAAGVVNAINAGSFMLQHRDHGSYSGWGEPDFQSSNINSLNNVNNKLPYIFSINCQTGAFHNSSETFAEKFHRHTYNGQNSGALGVMAATEVSYSFVNDAYLWGVMDNLFPDFMGYTTTFPVNYVMPAFGNAAGKHFLYSSSWPYNTGDKLITYRLFHHHGDAFMTLYTEVPQNLTVSHSPTLLSGATSFNVTADAGSLIALTINGEIIGTAAGTGSPAAIAIGAQNPGEVMVVTVTKQNFFRYSADVSVIPPNGPYMTYVSHAINDASGNNNGLADFGENILLSLTLENAGSEPAYNVNATISCTDPYITITDNFEIVGTINSGSAATMSDAFEFTIDSNIPDQFVFTFELNIAGVADETWTSYFTITANAPFLEFGNLTINDNAGGNGNGRLDPGESADIFIPVLNSGHSYSPFADAFLSTNSNWLTVNTGFSELGIINPGGSGSATFNISCDPLTPVGTAVDLGVDVVAGNYDVSNTFYQNVGLVLEDFETGNFLAFPWTFSGTADWVITDISPYEGVYCAKSGVITHNQTSELIINVETTNDDYISFYRKVSSESSYDYLRFYIDGTLQAQWSGEVAWGQVSYYVPAGVHIFKWVYSKDGSVNTGSDCAWIDYIIFPSIVPPPNPPDISISPVSFDISLNPDEMQTETMTIFNSGDQDLNFNISLSDATAIAGKIIPDVSQELLEQLKLKNNYSNSFDELSSGSGDLQILTLPPVNKYGPSDAKGEETFGSWNGGTWTGGTRDRGNVFHVTTSTTLQEIRFYMNITASTQLYFFVYEGTAAQGFFTQTEVVYIASSGTGEGWYSSGSMNVALDAGKYYYIGTSWNGSVTYGRGIESVPLTTSFGTLETGITGTIAGYPPATTLSHSYTGNSPYYQTLVTSNEPTYTWLVPSPIIGTVSAQNSFGINVLFDATGLTEGTYTKNIEVGSNDPDQPIVIIPCTLNVMDGIFVSIKAFLEGPFIFDQMATTLNQYVLVPLVQPYNVSPWNYPGTENVAEIPNIDVVDWVLVELRETAGGPETATPVTIVERQAAFILRNGTIVSTDGSSPLAFNAAISDNLYFVVWHRNHLGIMSAYPAVSIGGVYNYDFTLGESQTYGGSHAHKQLMPGIWGMRSGDANGDMEINNLDKNESWYIQFYNFGYFDGDFDLNGIIDDDDLFLKWEINSGKCSYIVK